VPRPDTVALLAQALTLSPQEHATFADAARERLEAALAIFQRLGAHKDAERVEQTLANSRGCERETA
jgi:hypothetical protein